jgi:hypothetical protein
MAVSIPPWATDPTNRGLRNDPIGANAMDQFRREVFGGGTQGNQMSYWTPEALPKLRSSEGRYDQIHYPTGYTSSGVRSSASGGYGFLDSTWRTYAGQAGVDTNQYPRAYMAPPAVQDQVAAITPVSNWTCPNCNSTASRLARNAAYVSSTPQSGTGGSGGDSSGFSTSDDPAFTQGSLDVRTPSDLTPAEREALSGLNRDYGGGSDQPLSGGVNPNSFIDPSIPPLEPDPNNPQAPYPFTGQPQQQGGGLGAILTWGWDKLLRLALIVLGVLLVIVAAWAMVRGEFDPVAMAGKAVKAK